MIWYNIIASGLLGVDLSPGVITLAGTGGRSLNRLPPKNIIKERGKQNPRFFYGKGGGFMAEITDLLPMPPQFGPPLPGSFKVTWPWVKPPPPPPPVLAVVAPETMPAPAPKQAPPAPAPVRLRRASDYQVETPPELLHELSPIRIDLSWLQSPH